MNIKNLKFNIALLKLKSFTNKGTPHPTGKTTPQAASIPHKKFFLPMTAVTGDNNMSLGVPSNSLSMFYQLVLLPTVRRATETYRVHLVAGNKVSASFVLSSVNLPKINMMSHNSLRYYSCQGNNSKTK